MDQSLSAELEISNLAKFWIVWSKGMWICHFESEASFQGKWKFDARRDIACEAEHPFICISDIYTKTNTKDIAVEAEHPLPSNKTS